MKSFLILLICSLAAAEIKQCGFSSVYPENVVSGHDSLRGAWPWQVGIWIENHHNGVQCGGSILSEYWILTAAHCLLINKAYYTIVAGDYNQKDFKDKEQIRKISNVFIHPAYRPQDHTLNNDVALIQLQKPLVFNKYVSAVCLPEADHKIDTGTMCYVTGWGRIHAGRSPTEQATILQQTRLPIVSRLQCVKLNTKHLHIAVTDEMLCAGYGPLKREEVCHGDSGGPLVCQNQKGTWLLHGTTSWGPPNCNSNEGYSVFARISSFVHWIKKTTKDLS